MILNREHHNAWLFACLLFAYISILYGNTLHVPFMLDDRSNIVDRSNLHLSRITPQNIAKTFFMQKAQGQKIFRPISCLSIALNHYIGGFNVTGYHLLNIIIHCLTSFFLFKTILCLLQVKIPRSENNSSIQIAALSTILWAAHPIQTQAVTYIIQRMASISAMFYILGLWNYIIFRSQSDKEKSKNLRCLILSIVFFLCSILSKENGVLFPLGIICVELFFFDGFDKLKTHPIISVFILFCLASVPLLFFVHSSGFEKILSGYDHRPFTITQRLLTEPRILFFYLSQLFYPVPGRFSISHSFSFSNSLFDPLSTILSIALICLIFVLGFFKAQKYPFITFPIVFFFLHHIVESSIIPLELLFEHRNYLPSIFIFLPISFGFFSLLQRYKKNKPMYHILIIFCSFIIFLFGVSTHLRNTVWKTHTTFWEDAVLKSSDQIRPYSQLGWYYTNTKRSEPKKARAYFIQGLKKNPSYDVFEKALLWLNIAKTHEQESNLAAAEDALLACRATIESIVKASPVLKDNPITERYTSTVNFYLANVCYTQNKIDQGLAHIELVSDSQKKAVTYNTKAKLLIKKKAFPQALINLQISLKKDHSNWETHFWLGNTLTNLGHFSQGLWFYKLARKTAAEHQDFIPFIELYMADTLFNLQKPFLGDKYLNQVLKNYSFKDILSLIKTDSNNPIKQLTLFNETDILLKLQKKTEDLMR